MGFQQWSFYGLRAQHGCGREQRGLRCREAQDFHLLSQRRLEKPPRHWRVVNLTTHWSQDPVGSLPRTIPSRTSSDVRFCFLPNACLLLLTVEIFLHIHGKQLQTLNPGPRSVLVWGWSLHVGLSDYTAWKHTQTILADAIGFPLLFGNCFSL